MVRYRAAWILPISRRPIRDGWVETDRGRITAVGQGAPTTAVEEVVLGDVAVMPGLVNAHTHLELSYLRGRIPPATEFVDWIRRLMAARRDRPDPRAPEIVDAIDSAVDEALACGTAVVGDISNTLVPFDSLARSQLAAVVFYELIRFNAADPASFVEAAVAELAARPKTERVRASLAAHAPYSVGPAVFRAIRGAIDRDSVAVTSVHLAESPAETVFVRTGEGPWRTLLEELGVWDQAWTPPGVSAVQYMDDVGFFDARALAVHCVQANRADLARLKSRGATVVTCPRSNVRTGVGAPPIEDFYDTGVAVAIGTDSLASAPDLNVFAELAAAHAMAPSVPPARLLDSATREGARALGFGGDYGTIEAGKRARLIAVTVPPDLTDVEEYLVSGVTPAQIRWIDEHG